MTTDSKTKDQDIVESIVSAAVIEKSEFDEALRALSKREAIIKRSRAEFQTAVSYPEFHDLLNAYHAVERLQNEADSLNDFLIQDVQDAPQQIFSVDPHLISVYSEYWSKGKWTGLELTPGELSEFWPTGTDKIQPGIAQGLSIVSKILLGEPLILLDSGRHEIANLAAFFASQRDEVAPEKASTEAFRERATQSFQDFSQHTRDLDALGNQIRVSRAFSERQTLISRYQNLLSKIAGIISDLCASTQMGKLVRLQRLNSVLGRSLTRPFGIMSAAYQDREQMGTGYRNASKYAEFPSLEANRIFQSCLADHRISTLRRQIRRYYQAFLSSDWANDSTDDDFGQRGRLDDAAAIFDVHLLNTILSILGETHQVRHITMSNKISKFVSAFRPGVLRTQVCHPRFYPFFDRTFAGAYNAQLLEIMDALSAFKLNITSDGSFSTDEIDRIQKDLETTGDSTDSLFQFSYFAEGNSPLPELRNEFITLLQTIGNDNDDPALLAQQAAELSVEQSKPMFDRLCANLIERVIEQAPTFGQGFVFVRLHRSTQNSEINRLVCLPAAGGARYLFRIHNTDLIRLLFPKGGEVGGDLKTIYTVVPFSVLLAKFREANNSRLEGWRNRAPDEVVFPEDLEQVVTDDDLLDFLLQAKAAALDFFINAMIASSLRRWTLVQSMCHRAIDVLDRAIRSTKIRTQAASDARFARQRVRMELLQIEIQFLLHLAHRGEAANYHSGSRSAMQFVRAIDALNEANNAMSALRTFSAAAGVEEQVDFGGLRQNEFRFTLAALGTTVEMACLLKPADLGERMGQLDLWKCDNPSTCPIALGGTKFGTVRDSVSNPASALEMALAAAKGLAQDIDVRMGTFQASRDEQRNDIGSTGKICEIDLKDSQFLLRYRKLRALEFRIFWRFIAFSGFNSERVYFEPHEIPILRCDFEDFCHLYDEHIDEFQVFISQSGNYPGTHFPRENHLAEFLVQLRSLFLPKIVVDPWIERRPIYAGKFLRLLHSLSALEGS